MRKIFYLLLTIWIAQLCHAQPTRYGNEWIDYTPGKVYYKVKVMQDSVYRIPYSVLNATIPNLSSINPDDFVMYHNGTMVPIFVSDTIPGGVPDTTMFIEFYGRKNIGDIDSVLYPKPGYQPHTLISFFTDTAIYFLTTRSGGNNPRFRVVQNDITSIPSLTEEPYMWFTFSYYFAAISGTNNTFSAGTPYLSGTDYIYKSIYDNDEHWGSKWINKTSSVTAPLEVKAPYLTGPKAYVSENIFTRTYVPHYIVTTLNSNPFSIFDFNNSAGGYSANRFSDSVPAATLLGSNPLKITDTATGNSDLLMYAEIQYARKYDFAGKAGFRWKMSDGPGKRYFKVNNFPVTTSAPILYDLTNGYIINSTDPPATLPKSFVIPAATGERELYLRTSSPTSMKMIVSMDTVTFQDYTASAAQGNYVIITNNVLRHDSINQDPVRAYANYRDRIASPSTGKYDVRIFDIDQLYDQFGYGVKKSSLAIRNFVEYAVDHWTTRKPDYLFIIGKGRDYKETRENAFAYNQNLVPTFGRYPSDVLLTCRRGSNRPLMAVGRLAAQKPTDIYNYLNKITEYERLQATFGDPHQTKAEKLWMKQIMHFSGGSDIYEQGQYAGYLQAYADTARSTSWGANTFTINKTSSVPVDNSESDIIRSHINAGTSLMTFFGHASGTTFDISVDDPTNWTNFGKYPVIYSNGCQSGDISSSNSSTPPPLSFSELSVLTPGRCAIAFTATSSLSVSSSLDQYAHSVYQYACKDGYDKPWGKALQNAVITQDSLDPADDFAMIVAYEMTLHGDPALTLNQYTQPDYEIDQSSVYFSPQTVDPSLDSFKVNVIVTNLGKAINDSIQIRLTRKYTDRNGTQTIEYRWKVKATYYIDTFSIKIPTFLDSVHTSGSGQNVFDIYVESEFRIAELSETNNGSLQHYDLFIQADDVLPIYPYDFAIVPNQKITLKASTVDPFAPVKTYRMQIDTAETFRHPIAQTTITQRGGVIHWTLPITFTDSTVYYWRVSRDSINDSTSYIWHGSSFVYIKNEYPGWNQSHYYQYGHDNYNDNIYQAKDRVFKFVPNVNTIHVTTGLVDFLGGPLLFSNIEWDLNLVTKHRYNQAACNPAIPHGFAYNTSGGVTFAVIDTVTGAIWQSFNVANGQNTAVNNGKYLNYHCWDKPGPMEGFDFDVNSVGFDNAIANFLDSIPNGNIVLMYTVNKILWNQWGTLYSRSFNKLVAMGATDMTLLKNGQIADAPYIFFTMKGNPAMSKQVVGSGGYARPLEGTFTYGTLWNKGTFASTIIGPSTEWGSFHWRHRARENTSSDQQSVQIVGIPQNGLPVSLLTTQALDTTINFINAAQYPYLQLRLSSEDDTTHTPTQLYYWRILYKKVPEAAINPAAHFYVQKDTFALSDTATIEVALENVTDLPMDSMRTLYDLKNLDHPYHQSTVVKSDSLRAFQTQILRFRQSLNNNLAFAGKNRLVIEANPIDALHQPEQYHFNNYATVDFSAVGDNVNPLLDVTFDGRRILNNDLISAKPDVLITMKDENKTLALNDTSLAQIYILYPGQTVPTLINYDNSTLTFYPATGNIAKRNQARIDYKPTFTMDGVYSLLIRDKDRSNNYSSTSSTRYQGSSVNGIYYDYKISFNVITRSMITNVLNYPNPFSTRTQFVFTLTGSDVPDYMKIQIMTITGKVVKEIQRAELGDIHVGVNRTSYYWDGRDEFGDKLANGVYFYRVITKIDDKNVDHMSSTQYGQFFNNTNIDKYFKHGFGKLVIMR